MTSKIPFADLQPMTQATISTFPYIFKKFSLADLKVKIYFFFGFFVPIFRGEISIGVFHLIFSLQSITIVDTPGILSGEKQRTSRGYEFTGVLKWFADRADRILLLFDAHKLDISDEFKLSIEALHGNDDKIRIVLNKVGTIKYCFIVG